VSEVLSKLGSKAQRGSKPRCHRITHGTPDKVAARLTSLAAPWATVQPTDGWMPKGFDVLAEPQLHQAPRLVPAEIGRALAAWWLPAGRQDATTPNFDIASTCTIDGKPGLLLVEAKAHDEELIGEAGGRRLAPDATDARKASHGTIGEAIELAKRGLDAATGLEWGISRDTHYQISNRFAWAWKLANSGVPVVLIYLGFLNCAEMSDRGRPFGDHAAWEGLVRDHVRDVVPGRVWNRSWAVNGVPFIPLIQSVECPFDREIGA
jgi:hypothetical protein